MNVRQDHLDSNPLMLQNRNLGMLFQSNAHNQLELSISNAYYVDMSLDNLVM